LQPVGFIIYLISGIAENNRSPFDLPETENELVSGFATEFGGIKFALFFIAEYANMVVISSIVTTVFLGGWQWPAFLANIHPIISVGVFFAKVWAMLFLYVWIRASLPRVRFDKLMNFSWKFMFPLAVLNLVVTAVIVVLVTP
jgi:NADH-quinone oxidoreductase subunit H